MSETSPELLAIVQAFPFPWSAYVRLPSVKSPQARASRGRSPARTGGTAAQAAHGAQLTRLRQPSCRSLARSARPAGCRNLSCE